MKGTVEQYARGDFNIQRPDVTVSQQYIQLKIEAGTVYEGSFSLQAENKQQVKAMVYDSPYLLEFEKHIFIAESCSVQYSFDATNYTKGKVFHGHISIITDGGEYKIPYDIEIVAPYINTSEGPINDMFQFASLAEHNWKEAIRIFESGEFKRTFLDHQSTYEKTYQSLSKSISVNQSLEEFLVFIHKKRIVMLSVNQSKYQLDMPEERVRQSLLIRKNTWGYTNTRVRSDSRFIELPKKHLTMEDFTGNVLELEYYINPAYIEEESATGFIYIENVYQCLQIEITVKSRPDETAFTVPKKESDKRSVKANQYRLTCNYLDFRIGRLTLEDYISKNMYALSNLAQYVPHEPMYKLGMLHMHILAGDIEFAEQECKRIEADSVKMIQEEMPACYYNYLKALLLKEEDAIHHAVEMIKEQMGNATARLFYFWLLIYLDTDYAEDKTNLYQEIEQLYEEGMNSPVLYYEICDMLNNDPLMLRRISGLEISAIRWGMKKEFLTGDVLRTFVTLAAKEHTFRPQVFKLLKQIYELYKEDDCLYVMVSMLIKGNRYDKQYHTFYGMAVEKSMKIIGLNECFLRSMDFHSYDMIPYSVLMYMNYKNTLTEQELTYLYANVVTNKDKYMNIYHEYVNNIEAFMEEQILKGSMSDDLAVIYSEFLDPANVKSQYAPKLVNIIFKRKLTCTNENIKAVIVKHRELEEEVQVPLVHGVAYVEIITESAAISLVDTNGNRYVSTVPYRLEKLVEETTYIDYCLKYNPTDYRLLLYVYQNITKHDELDAKGVNIARDILESEEISYYKKQMALSYIVQYYYENYEGDILEKYLQQVDLDYIQPDKYIFITELFILQGLCEKAFAAVKRFGFMGIEEKKLLYLASYLTAKEVYFEDETVTAICIYLYRHGKFNDPVIEHLIHNFRGTVEEMGRLWQDAKAMGQDTRELEENTLAQMMFSDSFSDVIYDIFLSYYHDSYRGMVVKGFLKKTAFAYFIQEAIVPDEVFTVLYDEIIKGNVEDELSDMAMLQYFSTKKVLDTEKMNWIAKKVQSFVAREKVLPFFKKFHEFVVMPRDIFLKTYLVFKSQVNRNVIINYSFGTTEKETAVYKTERLNEMLPGLYVKEFVVFHGERLLYTITEKQKGVAKIIENDNMEADTMMKSVESRFEMINSMLMQQEMQEDRQLLDTVNQYLNTMHLFEENLKIL